MEEIWKPIEGFAHYQISNYGRVRGMRVEYLKWLFSKRGRNYPFVDLRGHAPDNRKKRKICLIHLLVAQAFLGPRPKGLIVHHLDGNRKNPCVTNLMYVTSEENARPEEWRQIGDYPDYEVSNLGRVRSHRTRRTSNGASWILKNMTNRGGDYAFVGLYRNTGEGSKRKLINVHNLVAQAFLGPRPKGMVIDHINGIRSDPRASNLRYITPQENSRRRARS